MILSTFLLRLTCAACRVALYTLPGHEALAAKAAAQCRTAADQLEDAAAWPHWRLP